MSERGGLVPRIEPGIRRAVKLLRDKGFSTYSSCEQRIEVAIEMLSRSDDLARLDRVLAESDFEDYTIVVRLARSRGVPGCRFKAMVQFGDQWTRQRIARRIAAGVDAIAAGDPRRQASNVEATIYPRSSIAQSHQEAQMRRMLPLLGPCPTLRVQLVRRWQHRLLTQTVVIIYDRYRSWPEA